ncbi:hypothetical protein SLA2020_006550 [Shorea laevis]
MDFMKVFDQTVREIKREVNLKVLKVPEMEQKVLDATDNEPWGPHGTALAEIAQATKKFSECQMVMNVLWTRLGETGKDWRYVYKALAVIEYLICHGSERAVDDIIEHTFQISSLTSFEYVEPSGKDMGINVRKKAENIVNLLNNKDKMQEARNKASANRDKYFGLSSSGITYKSGAPTFSSGGFSGDRYGGLSGKRDGDSFQDSSKERDWYGEEKTDTDTYGKSRRSALNESQRSTSKKDYTRYGSKDQDHKFSSKSSMSNKYSQSTNSPSNDCDDDFDDFDPRGTSSTKMASGSSNQVDLFGQSLIDFDEQSSVPTEKPAVSSNSSDVDLFADATFVSASAQAESIATSQTQQKEVDLFASQPTMTSAASSTVDFFAAPDPVVQPETKAPKPNQTIASIVDPFAAVPLNNFDGTDMFGSFTSHSDTVSTESAQNPANENNLNNLTAKSLEDPKPPQRKDSFQVKSGIWADTLSRGLIDLNISAPKKVNLADVGIVGGLSETDEREKGPTSFYMGRAMGSGSGLGRTGFPSSEAGGGDDFFSSLGGQQYQFNSLKK